MCVPYLEVAAELAVHASSAAKGDGRVKPLSAAATAAARTGPVPVPSLLAPRACWPSSDRAA